ncbi:MAG: glycosyltransferase [Donghicola eburneus]|nr:glycosyltransferase [Donghicola eburneus]MCI5041037.1 glycosyltransferase [Donghicola eburneus]
MTITRRPFAAVIIPHFNDHERLQRCLRALWRAGVPEDVEVVVVDNGSSPAVVVSGEFPRLRLVVEPLKGAANARNRGVAETTAPRLWFLDADCVPAPDWLDQARVVSDRASIVGGEVEVFDESMGRRSGAQGFEALFAFDCQAYVEQMGFAVTANLLTTRELFERAGSFTDGVPEDKEWCHRAVQAGANIVFEPRLRVGHPSRSDWTALRRKWRRLTQEAWSDQRRKPYGKLRWAVRSALVMISGIAHLPRVVSTDKLCVSEKFLTALTLLRLRAVRGLWMIGQITGARP